MNTCTRRIMKDLEDLYKEPKVETLKFQLHTFYVTISMQMKNLLQVQFQFN